MSRMLNLADRLLAMGRSLHKLGRDHDAVAALERLSQYPALPRHVAEEAHARLGELYLGMKKYRRARRHLALALARQPEHPHYHFLLAGLLEKKGDLGRAGEHYRRSLELEPDQPRCLAAYGLLTMRQGNVEDGLTCLRCAAEMAPEDARTLRLLVKGLCRAGRSEEAERALRLAAFRDPRFRRLWNDYRFKQVRREQARQRRREQGGIPALLPFVRVERFSVGQTQVRLDGPSAPRPLALFRDRPRRAQ
jgi:tetratricopeptide (TPR) repeat protein